MKIRNTFIIFIVSGFWHGANWTFIVWGALNAVYFLPLLLRGNNRNNLNVVAENGLLPSLKEVFQVLTTFGLTVLAWIFFRADSMTHALGIVSEIFSSSTFSIPDFDKRHMAFYFIVPGGWCFPLASKTGLDGLRCLHWWMLILLLLSSVTKSVSVCFSERR